MQYRIEQNVTMEQTLFNVTNPDSGTFGIVFGSETCSKKQYANIPANSTADEFKALI